jgi:hypothetical protein
MLKMGVDLIKNNPEQVDAFFNEVTRRKNCIKDFNATVRLQTEVNTKAQKQPHFCKHFKFS